MYSYKYPLLLIFLLLGSFCLFPKSKFPEKYTPVREYSGQTIWDVVNVSEENIDIGLWALIIAKEYNAIFDIKKNLKKLDEMAAEINEMLAGRTKDLEKMLMIKTFLYEPGIWNNQRPFTYDLDDPLGNQLENQLLSTYMTSRKGNCVSMPTMFIALMERIDPNVPFRAVRAPLHLFCRVYDRQTGDVWNVETTNGGHPARNQWYVETLSISQESIESGIYLADMSKRELIADLIQPLMLRARLAKDYESAFKYADLALQLNPEAIYALVNKGAMYAQIGYEAFEKIKVENRDITPQEKEKIAWYDKQAGKYIEKALKLAWKPETKEQQEDYLKTVRGQKNETEQHFLDQN